MIRQICFIKKSMFQCFFCIISYFPFIVFNNNSANPFIGKVMDGSGDISLTAEEHEVLTEYFRLRFRLDDMERQRLYFRGHADCISYLKKIGALN